MTVTKEVNVFDLYYGDQLWSGAADTVRYLSFEEVEQILSALEDSTAAEEPWSETELNDYFWYETQAIAEILGYDSFDEIMHREQE